MPENIAKTYQDAQITVKNDFLTQKLKPVLQTLGWEYWGSIYGAGDFVFTRVQDAQEEPVKPAVLEGLIDRVRKEGPPGEKIPITFGAEPEEIPFTPPIDERVKGSRVFGAAFHGDAPYQLVPAGFRGEKAEALIDMPGHGAFEIETGTEGGLAFLKFESSTRSVTVRFRRDKAIDVLMSCTGLFDIALMSGGVGFLKEALTDTDKLEELLAMLPAACEALSRLPGSAGRGAKRIQDALGGTSGMIRLFHEILQARRGADEPEDTAQESEAAFEEGTRPAPGRPPRCPSCGRVGRPTGRTSDLGVGGVSTVFACDNAECDLAHFKGPTPEGQPPPEPAAEPPEVKCPMCGEPAREGGMRAATGVLYWCDQISCVIRNFWHIAPAFDVKPDE